jgi:hypothetical protein
MLLFKKYIFSSYSQVELAPSHINLIPEFKNNPKCLESSLSSERYIIITDLFNRMPFKEVQGKTDDKKLKDDWKKWIEGEIKKEMVMSNH